MDEPTGLIEKKLPLHLNGLEVVYLTDAVANGDIAQGLPARDAYVPLARELLLIMGSVYCECVFKDGVLPGPYTVYLTEEQVWLMRSKVRTADLDLNGANIGIGLSKKLYRALLEFHADLGLTVTEEGDQAWPGGGPDLLYAGGYV